MLAPEIAVALRLLLIAALALLARWGVRLLLGRLARRLEQARAAGEQRSRLKTLLEVGRGVADVLIVLIAGLTALGALGIDIGPLLAGAGLIGLALSLGAQTLIRDFLGGVLILAEQQFSVGDVIKVGELSGSVEAISLRATQLRDLEGRLHILSNGDIRTVSNLTAHWSRALVDLNVDYTADMGRVLRALEAAAARAQADEAVKPYLLEAPQTVGWIGFKDWAVQMRLIVKTAPGKQWLVMNALRRYAVEALQAEGVPVALPAQNVHLKPPPPAA